MTGPGWTVGLFNEWTVVTLVQDVEFEEGDGTEAFTYRIKNRKVVPARILYQVAGPDDETLIIPIRA